MKKGLVVVVAAVLMSAAAVGAFAQEKSASVKKIWLSGEVGIIGGGARFEFMLTPKLSVGVNGYWNSLFFFWNEFGANAVLRFYPWGKTFYAGLGLGYGQHTGTETYEGAGYWAGSSYADLVVMDGFGIVPELGWKIDVGNPGGFF